MMRLGGGGDTRIVSLQESSPSWRMVCFAPFFVLRSEGTYRDDSPQWFGEGIGSNGGDLDSMLQAAPGEVASLCSFTGANALARMRSTSHILVQHVSSPAEHAHISCEGVMGTCTARHGEEADFPARCVANSVPRLSEFNNCAEFRQIRLTICSFSCYKGPLPLCSAKRIWFSTHKLTCGVDQSVSHSLQAQHVDSD